MMSITPPHAQPQPKGRPPSPPAILGTPGADRGPIPLAENSGPRPAPPAPASRPDVTRCPACGYSAVGLVGATCPECGADMGRAALLADRKAREARDRRAAYFRPMTTAAVAVVVMMLAVVFHNWASGEMDILPARLVEVFVSYVLTVPAMLVIFTVIAALWFGSDDPLLITLLRLAAACAFADAAGEVVTIVWLLFLTRILMLGAYIAAYIKLLDLEPIEAVALAVITVMVKYLLVSSVLGHAGIA